MELGFSRDGLLSSFKRPFVIVNIWFWCDGLAMKGVRTIHMMSDALRIHNILLSDSVAAVGLVMDHR
jgi:hypothetical protein